MAKKKKGGKFLTPAVYKRPSAAFAIPFFLVLFALSVVAFIIPLRPTESIEEKRNLAEFPEFSLEALLSGDYFDDITLWFSDTFPGRDRWISMSKEIENLHGTGDVLIYGDITVQDTVPSEYTGDSETRETRPPEEETTQDPLEDETIMPSVFEPLMTAPTEDVEHWGGVNAGEDAEIYLGSVIQVGDTAFNYFGFSQNESDRFINTMNWFAEDMASKEDVNVVLAVFPTSVGVLVEEEYQEKIKCAEQGSVIDYLYSGISDDIIKVNAFDTLVEHNDEYIYFRTDHHWTALGAYYTYREICASLDLEPAELDSFEVWDQGTFRGSNYYKCSQSSKLELDNVYAYNPTDDITMIINDNTSGRFSWPLLTDMSKSALNSKYMTFLAGDHALCEITNNDLQNGKSCVILKDSYGNAIAPFFTQNYQYVYVMDFREYHRMNLQKFVDTYEIDDVILTIQVGAPQNNSYNNLIRTACGV